MLRNGCQNQPRFHHREAIADANTRTTAKRQIGVAWNTFFPRRSEPLRIEALRIREEPWVMVKDVRADGDQAPFGDLITSDCHILDRLPCKTRGRWIKAKSLANDHFGIRQPRQIAHGCRTARKHKIEFGVTTVLSSANCRRMDKVMDYFAEVGVYSFRVNPLLFTVNFLRGAYLVNQSNPYRPHFNDIRIGVWYAFTH